MTEELEGLALREAVARMMHGATRFYTDEDGIHKMRTAGGGSAVTPAYETDLNAAWAVVERMRVKRFQFTLQCWGRDGNEHAFAEFQRVAYPHWVQQDGGDAYGEATHTNAATAICQAALAAARAGGPF